MIKDSIPTTCTSPAIKNIREAGKRNEFRYHLTPKLSSQSAQPQKRAVYLVDDDNDDLFFSALALKKSTHIEDVHKISSAKMLFQSMHDDGLFDNSYQYTPTNCPIILMDIHMPQTDGIQVLNSLRDHPATQELPVILLTSDISGEKVHKAYSLHASGYLQKPFNLLKFHDILEKIAQGYKGLSVEGHSYT